MRPDRFPRRLARLGSLSRHGLRWIRATTKPVRSNNGKEELGALLLSVPDRAFKGEL